MIKLTDFETRKSILIDADRIITVTDQENYRAVHVDGRTLIVNCKVEENIEEIQHKIQNAYEED